MGLSSMLQLPQSPIPGLGHDITDVGNTVGTIGNALSGHVLPTGVPSSLPATMPTTGAPTPKNVTAPIQAGVSAPSTGLVQGVAPPSGANVPGVGVAPAAVQVPGSTSSAGIPASSFNSVYGNDVGGEVAGLLNSESPGTANSTAQAIINANAPNVAQGSAQLNTGLAASGISPSSSVSAIENANYEAQVQQQNTAEFAETNMQEQQMQQQLLEDLLPTQQQRETESSGWSIFGDVLSGIGSIIGL